MPEIVVAGALRTPQGNLGGALKGFTNQQLGACLVRELLEKTHLDPGAVDEVIFGCVGQYSDAPNLSRVISLMAGIPAEKPAFTVARNCASGFQALVSAYHTIFAQDAEVIVAGGVEVMSSAPFINRDMRFGKKLRHSTLVDSLWEGLSDPVSGLLMGQTAENLAAEFNISRQEQDEFAVLSHQRAFHAAREGKFKTEIMKVKVPKRVHGRDLAPEIFEHDEGPNPALNMQMLSQYPPIFQEGGTVTAGNSCPISDGAAAVIVTTAPRAKSLGLEVWGKIRGYAFSGVRPEKMGLGPVAAIPAALRKAKMDLKNVQLTEINEAFAAQYLAVEKSLKLDRDRVNVNGGAIALGHPVGATGMRMVVTLLSEMKRRDLSVGLASLCVGGGQGGAIVLERL